MTGVKYWIAPSIGRQESQTAGFLSYTIDESGNGYVSY